MSNGHRMPGQACIVLPLLAAAAMAVAASTDPAPLFADDSLLEVTIDAPIKTLMDVRPDKAELKGAFAFTDTDGAEKRIELKLRTRGNYRRAREHCDFAPIRLNFRKSEVRGTLFDGQDKLKLVTHCMSFERDFEEVLVREYLAYRLFRELTDVSYGVRLLRVTYFDTQSDKELTRLAFLIEDDKDVANRNGLNMIEARFLQHDYHDRARQNLVHVFEYMIGNTEYSLVNPEPGEDCCHNADILSATESPPYIALPFDFDFSGLVNAPYAEPNPKYPINSVRRRFYKGLCSNNDILPETLEVFRHRRADMYRAIDSISDYGVHAARAASSTARYLDTFFDTINDPERVRERLIERCLDPETTVDEAE
ncbi:MAG: hypothetical protein P8Y01_04670 [Woeseiaceae bacterium]